MFATSCGVPSLLIGFCCAYVFRSSGVLSAFLSSGVSMGPGSIALMRIPFLACSCARHFVSMLMAALVAQYAADSGSGAIASPEVMLMMFPLFFLISGSACLHIRNVPLKFVSVRWSSSSLVVCSTGAWVYTPALLTSTSSFLISLIACCICFSSLMSTW